MQAAMGATQTRKIEAVIEKKRRVAAIYNRLLAQLGAGWLQTPPELDWARNVYWMYAVVVRPDAPIKRDVLLKRLRDEGVDTRTFFCPMSQQPCVTRVAGYRPVATPIADRLWTDGFYLPSSPSLTEQEIASVCQAVARAGRA
jgi:perosamine synthetase